MSPRMFRRDDPVSFKRGMSDEYGFVASVEGRTALVILDDGREFRVAVGLLRMREGVPPRRILSRNDSARMEFAENDRVSFLDSDQNRHVGHIVKINPKYARVKCDDVIWQVAYVNLRHAGGTTSASERSSRLSAIEAEAEMLLEKHGLESWCFEFDHAMRRGGRCDFDRQEISLSEQFASAASDDEVTDTLLHEIAHALVGPRHGHDAIWKATAHDIGCSGRVTHDIDFSSARWVLTCPKCGWKVPRLRRRKGLVCVDCGGKVEFQPNEGKVSTSDNRWIE